jgi:glutathione synthase/RimK-type ligase-like ATP-grasp enzyme
VHDGQIVNCPTARQPGKTYQRLIETGDGAWAEDLRTPCVGGVPVLVFVKAKLAAERFSIQNKTVTVKAPREVFTTEEIATITRFCAAMGVDWGGLDILRERGSGRLYIVDVNKTDTGPAVILSWKDRVRVTSLLADALTKLVRASRR